MEEKPAYHVVKITDYNGKVHEIPTGKDLDVVVSQVRPDGWTAILTLCGGLTHMDYKGMDPYDYPELIAEFPDDISELDGSTESPIIIVRGDAV